VQQHFDVAALMLERIAHDQPTAATA